MENTSSEGTSGEAGNRPGEESVQPAQPYPGPERGHAPYGEAWYGQSAGAPPPPPPSGGAYPPPPGYPPSPGQGYQGFPPPGVPQGPYGPYGPYGAYPPPPAQGFNFQSMLRRWQTVLTQPGVATFDTQQSGANWRTILLSLLLLGGVRAVTGFISALVARGAALYLPPGYVPPNESVFLKEVVSLNPISSAIGGLISAFVGFFVLSGILYLSAKVFGGVGSFLMQSWLLSLVYVPIGILSAVIGLVPILGGLVVLALGIYEIVLNVFAIASAYRMPNGRATAVVLVPFAVLFVLACALGILAAGLLFFLAPNLGL